MDFESKGKMEKNHFNKAIKEAFASRGLFQSKRGEYTIVSTGQDYYVIIKAPDMKTGFVLGIIPADTELMPEFKNTWLRNYEFELELCLAEYRFYTEKEIENSVNIVFSAAILISQNGKDGIINRIDKWTFIEGEREKNEIRKWLGMPSVDYYSSEYLREKIDLLKRGGFSCIPLSEFLAHEDFYRRYEDYGFKIVLDKKGNRVIISSSYVE